ncbi:MAG: magnesium transporter CorA family protein [Minisyncoccota bacterium]
MKKIYRYEGGEWIDLHSPTPEEVREAAAAAGIDPSVAEELLSPSLKHKIQFHDYYAFIVLYFPALDESERNDAAYEIDFILTKNNIITTHYERVRALEQFQPIEENTAGVFFGILEELLGNFEHKLSSVDHWMREIENKMFSGQEKHTILELSEISRHLIDFKKITAVYPELFEALTENGSKLLGKKAEELSKENFERFNKSKTKLEILADTAKELRETNNSLLSTKQNQTMKTLTWVTIIATIIVGIALIWVGLLAVK